MAGAVSTLSCQPLAIVYVVPEAAKHTRDLREIKQ